MTFIEKILSFFFRHVDIVKTVDGEKVLYLRRWFLWKIKGRWHYLHRILRSDDDPDPHDHPWDFTTVVLKNGYNDDTYVWNLDGIPKPYLGLQYIDRLVFLSRRRRSAEHIHQVKKRNDGSTWTYVIRGPYRREWGFWTADGWVFWRKYLNFWGKDPYDPEGKEP